MIDAGAAVTPQFGPQRGVYGDSHVLCLPRGMPAQREEEVWRFITYLSNHSAEWAQGGQVPVRKSARASETFRALPVQAVFAQEIGEVAYLPNTPVGAEVSAATSEACRAVVCGERTPAEALKIAQQEIERILARDREMAQRIAAKAAADGKAGR